MLKNPQKILDPDPDDFQNFISSPLSTDTYVVHRYICGHIANRQTDKRWALHNILGGRNSCMQH